MEVVGFCWIFTNKNKSLLGNYAGLFMFLLLIACRLQLDKAVELNVFANLNKNMLNERK